MGITDYSIAVSAVFSLVYAVFVFRMLKAWKSVIPVLFAKGDWPFISVIVCMRNESRSITHTLTALTEQDYPERKFEIIVADDFSEDDSVVIAEKFAMKNTNRNIRVLKAAAHQKPGKKFALAEAVSHADGEIIAMTDADCSMSKDWLKTMVNHHLTSGTVLTAGPVRLTGNSFFQQMQQIEFMSLSGSTASFIQMKKPLMVNAANMMFGKKAFIDSGRMNPAESSASGDDTFFMLQLAERNPNSISFCKAESAIVETPAIESLSQFVQQRIRWASKTRHYPSPQIRLTGIGLFAFHFLILLFFILSFVNSRFIFPTIILVLSKYMADGILLSHYNRFFKIKAGMASWMVIFLIHPFYMTLIPLLTLKQNYIWKGRLVKT